MRIAELALFFLGIDFPVGDKFFVSGNQFPHDVTGRVLELPTLYRRDQFVICLSARHELLDAVETDTRDSVRVLVFQGGRPVARCQQ